MFAEIKPLLDWIYQHPQWAGVITFLVAFTESLAIVGLFIPGTVVMVAIGSLIGTGYIPLLGTVLWAIAGAISGDVLSFVLGYHFHERVRKMWPLRSYPELLQRGELFFKKHGGKSVFLGRFAGPVRPIAPLIAGMMSMSPMRFLTADIISGIIWAPLFLLPGILLGAASHALPPEVATQLILFVIGALLVLWCISWLIKLCYLWLADHYDRGVASSWQFMQKNRYGKFLAEWLRDPLFPDSHAQLGLVFLIFILAFVFLIITISIYHVGVLTALNQPIYHFMRGLRNPIADNFFVALSLLSIKILIPMWLAVFVWLAIKKYWWAAFHWLGIGLLIMGLTDVAKHLIHVARPPGLVEMPTGWSFPSGHSSVSLALFGFLAILLTREQPSYIRWSIYTIAGFFAGLIMLSRLYLTAHWLTDVVGGALLAILCIVLVTLSYRRKKTKPIAPLGVLVVAGVSLVLSWGWAFYHNFKSDLINYKPAWTLQSLAGQDWWAQNKLPMQLLYRTNRFGKPIEVLNVQWVGSLEQIENSLTQHGWDKLTKSSLLHAINALTAKNNKHSYYWEQLYQDRRAVSELEKSLALPQGVTMVTLRFWDSHYVLENGQTLWVGTIAYRKPWNLRLFKRKLPNDVNLPAVTDILTKDLPGYQWKKIQISPQAKNNNWDGFILLIKPNE